MWWCWVSHLLPSSYGCSSFSEPSLPAWPCVGSKWSLPTFWGCLPVPNFRKGQTLTSSTEAKQVSHSPVKQHALNVGVVQCYECNNWRLLFSKRKPAFHERCELEQLQSDISYSRGSKMEDLQLPEQLKCVEIHIHQCIDLIEKLCYSAYPNDVLCIHCGITENILESWAEESIYPYCNDCSSKEVYKRGATQKWQLCKWCVCIYYNMCVCTFVCIVVCYCGFLAISGFLFPAFFAFWLPVWIYISSLD